MNKINNFYFAVGFCVACLHIYVKQNEKYKNGLSVMTRFNISLHKKDLKLLQLIRLLLGAVGFISKRSENAIQLQVRSKKDLLKIIKYRSWVISTEIDSKEIRIKSNSSMLLFLMVVLLLPIIRFVLIFKSLLILKFSLPRLREILNLKLIIWLLSSLLVYYCLLLA